MKTRVAATLIVPLMIMGACSPAGQSANGGADQGKFAGLDGEILKWRQQIIAEDPLCKSTVADQKCEAFEVACKAERTVTSDDTAKGITARVVVSMTWSGFDPKFSHAQSGSRASEFTRAGSGWTRADHKPVNMTTCADL